MSLWDLMDSEKPLILDLFCGAGGAAMGYHRAGFNVVGVDIKPQPRYPFEFVQRDVLELLTNRIVGSSECGWSLSDFDAIHASPPCQAYSTLRHRTGGQYLDLVGGVRDHLIALGAPYVIENVEGAPLLNAIRLCGSSFGLGVDGRELRRHRRFETSFPILAPACQHSKEVVGVYGTGGGGQMTRGFKARGVAEAREALGTPWMTLVECAQAIPPAYTEYVGGFLMRTLDQRLESAA